MLGLDSTAVADVVGFHIGDSGNSNRLLINVGHNGSAGTGSLIAYTYASGSYTQRGNSFAYSITSPLWLRITRDGSNNCSFYFSLNGVTWQLLATQALTLTVSNIGYRVSTGGASEFILISDWLRTTV
jgi:hypothetical protein